MEFISEGLGISPSEGPGKVSRKPAIVAGIAATAMVLGYSFVEIGEGYPEIPLGIAIVLQALAGYEDPNTQRKGLENIVPPYAIVPLAIMGIAMGLGLAGAYIAGKENPSTNTFLYPLLALLLSVICTDTGRIIRNYTKND